MHTLISDGGSMTVGRRTANYTWGAFEVTLPEGLEQAEQLDDRLQDGYIYRPDDRGHGRAELTFVRADARIDMNASKSDLEQTLDGASERTKGDAYYTRQISGVGLGKVRLGVDVRQGDMVRVLLWSRYLELPVTAIIPGKSVDGSTPEMAAQVGGQMLRDAELLSKRNSEIDTAIAVEKRTRLNQVGAVDKKATQAKDTADQAKQATEDNRTYIDEQLDAAGVAVALGRDYLLQMEGHVAAGNTAAGRAEDLAAQAAAAAAEAVGILDNLNPLRDDVTAAHAEVARLHGEASQLTDQAAEHVRLASQHAADAKGYAQQALEHEAEGRRQANAALDAAGAAQDSAALAQGILNDADGILSQVQGYSQQASDALNDAESLLANAGGSGKSLGDVLLEVAQKQQETLTAHSDILDLHSEVLQKHSEAIRYVAMAAAQASSAAMYAAQAAQEALNVAADAARAAASAADAADEAAAAAENNRQAISKLEEADGKLQEADQKLQQQIDVLEDSQKLLANAVKILASAVAQAAAAAQYALQSADNAGKAAGEALTASEHNSSAIDAMEDTLTAREETIEAFNQTQAEIDAMQNDAITALEEQAAEIAELQNRSLNTAMVDREGSTHPDVTTFKLVNTTAYDVTVNNITPGTKIHADFYNRGSGDSVTFVRTHQYVATSTARLISADSSNQVVNLMWARPNAQQIQINLSSTGTSLSRITWTDVPGLSRTATGKITNGQLTIRGTWGAANRGSTYGIRVLIGTSVFKSFTTTNLGPLSFLGDGTSTYTVSVSNLKMNANQTLKVQVYSSAGNASQRSLKSATAQGSWIEHAS